MWISWAGIGPLLLVGPKIWIRAQICRRTYQRSITLKKDSLCQDALKKDSLWKVNNCLLYWKFTDQLVNTYAPRAFSWWLKSVIPRSTCSISDGYPELKNKNYLYMWPQAGTQVVRRLEEIQYLQWYSISRLEDQEMYLLQSDDLTWGSSAHSLLSGSSDLPQLLRITMK